MEKKSRGETEGLALWMLEEHRSLVRVASCEEDLERRRHIVVNVNGEIQAMSYGALFPDVSIVGNHYHERGEIDTFVRKKRFN